MSRASDVIVIGRGPAGLLVSSLVVEQGGQVDMIADGLGTLPLWGGQFDFRSYDNDRKPVADPWAWWHRFGDTHPGGSVSAQMWRSWWQHLRDLWFTMEIPTEKLLPTKNRGTVTPLGRIKPAFLVPTWQFTQEYAGAITLVGVPDLVDFPVEAMARVYTWTTGMTAEIRWLERSPSWRPGWNGLNWAWYLDTEEGRRWLWEQVKSFRRGSAPLVFPQILGVDHTESLIEVLGELWGRGVAEIPLPPPSVGGLRLQRRWERWLRRKGVRLVQGRVKEIGGDFAALEGRRIHGGHVVLATGGVLGGGLEVLIDGQVRDRLMGLSLGVVKEPEDLASIGYRSWLEPTRVAGSALAGCDPNRHGDGGAMMLLTSHAVFSAVSGQEGRLEHAGRF